MNCFESILTKRRKPLVALLRASAAEASVFKLLISLALPAAHGQPEASQRLQYAPDREYDLQHLSADLTIDYEKRSFEGVVVNTVAPLRPALATIRLDCGENLAVTLCEIAGQPSLFTRTGDKLLITAPHPLAEGQPVDVAVHYNSRGDDDGRAKERSKFHWIDPTGTDPHRAGFWTLGEPYFNRQWLPTWDYPNDLTTSEMRVTVPADWSLIGNGVLKSDRLSGDGRTRTFHWKMDEPHATYLISLAGGPFEIKRDEWRGVELMYVVPKGKGDRINDIFGATGDMLSFYSETFGVKYPWSKYAQTVAYDYSGGQENVTAATLEAGDWGDRRSGYKTSEHGLAHELVHQWFGDLVTCKHWGEIWLKEGFADLFADVYFEQKRGKNAYDRAVDSRMRAYISESRRFKRPLATHVYDDALSLFDGHTYGKGEAVLHTLRRLLGDAAFFKGLQHFLATHRHQLVDSHDLCSAMTEATGTNLEPFFDQWIFKPGHPVLEYGWLWDDTQKQVVLTVRQTQDTKDGTPIYDLNATVGLIGGARLTRSRVRLHEVGQTIRIRASAKPEAVLLDPDHDFLREMPVLNWAREEWLPIFKNAPNPTDREEAMGRILAENPADAVVEQVAEGVRADTGQFPAFQDIKPLAELRREDLRPLFREQMAHPDCERSAQAIRALGLLRKDEADIRRLRGLVNEDQPYAVVRSAIAALANWDAPGNRDVFQGATKQASPQDSVRLAALDALARADAAEGRAPSELCARAARIAMRFLSDRAKGVQDSPVMAARLRATADPEGNPAIAGFVKSLRLLVPLACDDVEASGLVEAGERISRICTFKLVTEQSEWYLQLSMTADERVAHLRVYNPVTWQMGLPQ